MAERILVLVVDRDDDIGKKVGEKGPIIGEEKNIEIATKLALADPEDTDANTIFAAVRFARELRESGKNVEIATVTGHSTLGFVADANVTSQLKYVFNVFPADGVVLVTDGAEDDQVIPIILSFAPIISKKTVVVKQSVQLEKTYYVIKSALRDKDLAPIVLGIPGLALLLWVLLGGTGIRLILGIIGAYLLAKGIGLYDSLTSWVRTVVRGFSLKGYGAPFYVLSLAVLFMAGYTGYQNLEAAIGDAAVYEAVRAFVSFAAISAILYLAGRSVDAHFEKRAFAIGKYIRYATVVLIIWALTDVITNILLKRAPISTIYPVSLSAIILYVFVAQISSIFDESIKHSKKLEGVTAYDKNGNRIGVVSKVDPKREVLVVSAGRKKIEVPTAKVKVDTTGVFLQV